MKKIRIRQLLNLYNKSYASRERWTKEAGCQFASKKKAWYWHAGEWVRKIRKTFTMDEIRSIHGSEIIQNAGNLKLAASH